MDYAAPAEARETDGLRLALAERDPCDGLLTGTPASQ